jgi:hypothetical protein
MPDSALGMDRATYAKRWIEVDILGLVTEVVTDLILPACQASSLTAAWPIYRPWQVYVWVMRAVTRHGLEPSIRTAPGSVSAGALCDAFGS